MQRVQTLSAAVVGFALATIVSTARADEPPPDETPPDVSITTPTDGASFPAGTATLSVEVAAADPHSGVNRVELKIDGKSVGKDTRAPWVFESVALTPGEHTLVATADNYDGRVGTSKPVKITLAASATKNATTKDAATKNAPADVKPDATPDAAADGCFASTRPRSAVPGIALLFAVAAGFMLRRRP